MTGLQEDPIGDTPPSTICVVTPYFPTLSETFIRAHVERLPAPTVLIYGWRPSMNGRPILSLWSRILHKMWRLAGAELARETTSAYVKAFRQHRAAAVLAEYGTTGVLTIEACRRVGIPLIVHFHGFDASVRSVLEANSETYPAMLHEAAAVIAVSRPMRDRLISLGAPPERIWQIPYGVDCRSFTGGCPESAPPIFLAVGRFVEKKAPQLTIRAFAEAHRAHPEARLRMVGEGPLLKECRELVQALEIEDAVVFLGMQSHAAVQEEMRQARCFVQHSIEAASGDCEGTPVGILEAGASGLPVISTRHAGIPEVVIDGETGLLVEERDIRGMSEHMIRLIQEPERAGQLGRAARQRIETHFTIEQSLGQLSEVINACVTHFKCGHDGKNARS